jgi:hypothetical protein
MCTFIIYCRNDQYLVETIDDLIDKTPPNLLKQIIICDENGFIDKGKLPFKCFILKTENIGRSRAYNLAATAATEDTLVFLQQPTKFSIDWLQPLLNLLEEKTLVSPVAYILDTNLWSFEDYHWQRYGLRWDFTVYDRKFPSGDKSPLAAFCFAIKSKFFFEIDGFDGGSGPGLGDNICLSLKTWFAGGEVRVADDSQIGIVPEIDLGNNTNITRLVEAWFPEYSTYYNNIANQTHKNVGRINKLVQFMEGCERNAKWWLTNLQPELLEIYALHGTAHGKRIAVVGDGASLDYTNWSWINSHDILIATNFLGIQLDCDYVVSNAVDVVEQLNLPIDKIVVPYMLERHLFYQTDNLIAARDVIPGAIQLEIEETVEIQSIFPPFCDFRNATLLALQFALFLGPQSISLFGFDNKILGGKSHTSLIKQYSNGEIWSESEQSKKRFDLYEFGLSQLSTLALRLGIPLIRVGHA